MSRLVRWVSSDGYFYGTGDAATEEQLPPGVYDLVSVQGVVFFTPVEARTDELLRFPDSAIDTVVAEIVTFWEREDAFRLHDLPYKRGILLYGPAGSGKSCTLQIVARDVVERGGVVLMFNNPDLFLMGYRIFRMIQPQTPLVVMMEDLDAILERSSETKVLNLLDGIEQVDKVVFVATTNFPEKLGDRIVNRPSRFDRRYKIPHPAPAARRMYLEALSRDGDDVDLDKWSKDTDGMSLAHLKELFIGVKVLGGEYPAVLKALRNMKEKTSSEDYDEFNGPFGQYV